MKKAVGFFMIVAGVMVLTIQAFSLRNGGLSPGGAGSYSAFAHVMAELASGLIMVFVGIPLARNQAYSLKSAMYAMGMFIYSVLQASGTSLQRGDFLLAALYVLLLGLGLTAVRGLMRAD
jgi:hypothetical protein